MIAAVRAFCLRSVDTQSDAPVSNCTFIHHAVNSMFAVQSTSRQHLASKIIAKSKEHISTADLFKIAYYDRRCGIGYFLL